MPQFKKTLTDAFRNERGEKDSAVVISDDQFFNEDHFDVR